MPSKAAVPAPRSLLPVLAAVLIALLIGACGTSAKPRARTAAGADRADRSGPTLSALTVSSLGSLPAAVEDAAAAPLPGGRMALLGGIDSAQLSTDSILVLDGADATPAGTLPLPQHDAQAATLGGDVYVFGGGQVASYDHILAYDPASASTTQVGSLPTPASDVAVASIGDTAYIVGGYTGASWLDTIIAWSPGGGPRVVAHLPVGLRYAAVAAAGRRLIIAGGTQTSAVSDRIYSFDPATGAVTAIGRLPSPLTHASAVFLDGRVVVVGGRRQADGEQTNEILAIDPSTGAVSPIGQLPQPLSDAAVGLSGGRVVVAGGDDGNGPQSAVLALTPHVRPG